MARRRRRRYNGIVQLPGMGFINKSVNTTDILVGAALGFAGTGALKLLGNKFLASKVPDIVLKGAPLVGGIVTGGIAYALQVKKNKSRATGHLTGAILAGASVQVWDVLKTNMPAYFGDVVSLNLGRYGGLLVDSNTPRMGPGAYAGLIVNSPNDSQANLGRLAEMSGVGDMNEIEELMYE